MAERKDPYLGNRFQVEIGGIVEAGFSECSGLVIETEVEERREGGLNDYAHRLPKGSRFVNLVLKRGLTDSDQLWKWHQDVVAGKVERRSVSVILRDGLGEERWRWNLREAFPTKWVGPELKSDGSVVAVETLEIAHHGLSKG
jgi:phage tail-like protein